MKNNGIQTYEDGHMLATLKQRRSKNSGHEPSAIAQEAVIRQKTRQMKKSSRFHSLCKRILKNFSRQEF